MSDQKYRNDDLLIDGMNNGDYRSFEKIYHKYSREMYFLSMGYTNDTIEAQDIVQETFVYLWNHRTSLNPNSNLRNYLRTSIRNSSLNAIRNKRIRDKHKKIIETETQISEAETQVNQKDHHQMNKEFESKLAFIKEKLEQLPKGCKKAFIMSVIEGFTYKEVSEQLGISINTVKTHIKIAYRKIRN